MRPLLTLACLCLFSLLAARAAADSLPVCDEGQIMDCQPSEHHHGCGGCIDDPNASGCSVGAVGAPVSGAAFAVGAMALGGALLRRRSRS